MIGRHWMPLATINFTNRLPMHHNDLNKIFTNHDWYKLVKRKNFILQCQNMDKTFAIATIHC